MALIGNMIADAFGGNPSIVNYDMFVAVFAMLSLFYLIAIAFNEGFMGHGAIPLALDVLNTLFFFCGAVATAAKLGVHSCGSKVSTTNTQSLTCDMANNSSSPTLTTTALPTARQTQASAAMRRKHRQPSYSSASHALQHPPSSPPSALDLAA